MMRKTVVGDVQEEVRGRMRTMRKGRHKIPRKDWLIPRCGTENIPHFGIAGIQTTSAHSGCRLLWSILGIFMLER